MKSISTHDFVALIKQNPSLQWIDVREVWEYEEENFGGTNIPLAELPQTIYAGDLDPSQTIYLACLTGVRASTAQIYLKHQGFEDVIHISGGVAALREVFQFSTDNQ